MPEGRKSWAPSAPSSTSSSFPGRVAFEGGAYYSFAGIGNLRLWALRHDLVVQPHGVSEGTSEGDTSGREGSRS